MRVICNNGFGTNIGARDQHFRKTGLNLASDPSVSSRLLDLLVVELSTLPHDVLDKKYAPESFSDPYAFFLPMFTELDAKYPSLGLLAKDGRRARLIGDIVTNVSWTTEKKLKARGGTWRDGCMELHCVQDADRLDAIGTFGTYTILGCERDTVNNLDGQES